MLSYKEYCNMVNNEQMIEYVKSFREMDDLSVEGNHPTAEEVIQHVEVVAKNKETFVSFILLCDRLDRKDKAFINLTTYHTLLTTKDEQEYGNQNLYVDLFNSSLKEGGIHGTLKEAIEYENKDRREGKLLEI